MSDADEFVRRIVRLAAMQICERSGFKGVKRGAWEALTDVLSARIELVARRAKAAVEVRAR